MFLGQYQHTIDNKGRLTIPARYREMLATDGAYVTQGFDHNLVVLTVTAFNQLSRRVNRMSMTDGRARQLKRQLFANAEHVGVDRAGRILIPQFLRDSVGLDAEAVLVGVGDYFEIWSPEAWAGQVSELHDAEADSQRYLDLDLSTSWE
jgi:MraZ protein